jgi:purine-binding chemotaxis protein CheW
VSSQLNNRYMEFRLADQLYAIPLLNVREVIRKPEVVKVPNMPAHFEGMMNLRGQILGVFSVRKKLNVKARDIDSAHVEVVIVIENEGTSVGMIVDEVTRVIHASDENISAAPLKSDDPAQKFVASIIQKDGELVLTVKPNELLELDKYKAPAKAA